MNYSDILMTVDYDRTLTAPDSTIPERNIEAIRFFIDKGGSFTVNSGRSLPMTRSFRDIVPVNAPLLLYNGSAAYDTKSGELINCHEIELEPEALIRDIEERFPELVLVQYGIKGHFMFHEDKGWERYCERNGCYHAYENPENLTEPLLKLDLCGQFRSDTVAALYEATPEELRLFDEATAYLKEAYGEHLELFRACARMLDIHCKGVSKLRAARDLQKQLGKKILICVGDAENDINMLDGADYAFCPADGIVADRYENVCACGEGAVADVIYNKIPEILKLA